MSWSKFIRRLHNFRRILSQSFSNALCSYAHLRMMRCVVYDMLGVCVSVFVCLCVSGIQTEIICLTFHRLVIFMLNVEKKNRSTSNMHTHNSCFNKYHIKKTQKLNNNLQRKIKLIKWNVYFQSELNLTGWKKLVAIFGLFIFFYGLILNDVV